MLIQLSIRSGSSDDASDRVPLGRPGVRPAHRDGQGTVGPEFRVNTYTSQAQQEPALATDALGNFAVTWNSNPQDGSAYGIFGQRYNMIVPVELMRFGWNSRGTPAAG